MKIITESAFKKIILLLICTAVMVTCIGSAVASDYEDQSSSPLATGTQEQSGYVSFTGNEVSYNLGQDQSAAIISGDGKISQTQQSGENVDIKGKNGKVTIVTARASEVQSVDTSSSYDSKNNNPSNEVAHINTKDGGEITLSQEQTEYSDRDINQEQRASLKIISTPNGKVHAKIHLQQK